MAQDLTSLSTKIDIFSAEILLRMRALLGFINLFPRNTNAGEFATHGQTLYIPAIAISGGLAEREIGGAATASDVASTATPVKMRHFYKGVKVDNLVNALTNTDLMPRLASDLAEIAVEGLDSVLYDLWKKIPYQVGKLDGTAAFNTADKLGVLADARLVATRNKMPRGNRYGILPPAEATELLKLDGIQNVNQAGQDMGRSEGVIGKLSGWTLDESNTTDGTHAQGTAAIWGAAPLVDGAAAIGAETIKAKALGAGTIPAGSIFSIDGIAYTVAEDAVIVANAATIKLNVPLKAAVADNAPITATKHTAASGIGLLFNPSAFLFVNRPLPPFMPGSGVLERRIVDGQTGLAFRLLFESQGQGGAGDAYSQKITLDLLCGAQVIRPEMAIRLAGKG